MFRQEEIFIGGWREKTVEAMQRRRFETMAGRLSPLGAQRLDALPFPALLSRIERSWQEIERKPLHNQQLNEIRKCVIAGVERHAACLSREEHNLVERALILGGTAQLKDVQELEAAHALSLRLWASVGLISGRPYIELDDAVMRPAAAAMERKEHERIRRRFEVFHAELSQMLYRVGVIDDRIPQQQILREVLQQAAWENGAVLARRYLWSSCDCMDYGSGVMLLHSALAEPLSLLTAGRRGIFKAGKIKEAWANHDILPEEIPLQEALERAIDGALRSGQQSGAVARDIRFLCKQGAPLEALEEVLQASLIVLITSSMRGALEQMYYLMPKWIENAELSALQ